MKIAATGHRPPRLGLKYSPEHNKTLTMFAKEALEVSQGGYDAITVISGMAQGWDQAVAHAAILLGHPVIAALPFKGQESKWPTDARRRYDAILRKAKEVKLVSDGGYSNEKYLLRDNWMVDNSDAVLALWDGDQTGGTFHTIRYAEGLSVPVANVWGAWEVFWSKAGNGCNTV